jgi:hypothetical protein
MNCTRKIQLYDVFLYIKNYFSKPSSNMKNSFICITIILNATCMLLRVNIVDVKVKL